MQLHGDESPEVISLINAPCMKVLHVSPNTVNDDSSTRNNINNSGLGGSLLQQAEEFSGKAIAILLDSRVAGSNGGGTGAVFDWAITEKLGGIPVLLAGGLTADNVADAVKINGVVGVDVASGVEQSAGKKDDELVRRFVINART